MSAPHRPGQAPWPEHHQRPRSTGDTQPIPAVPSAARPDRPPPIQFTADGPSQRQNPVLTWVLRGLGLLAIAVISGLVWWYINNDAPQAGSTATPTDQQTAGEFQFTPHEQVQEPRRDSTCAEHAYGEVQKFFQTTPCQQLTRALYTTTTQDGRKIYTSVSVVRMQSSEEAAKLRELADANGTGNVNDLIKEGVVKIAGLKSLSGNDGYEAVHQGNDVIIVESDFDPAAAESSTSTQEQDEQLLDRISKDAIRLGQDITTP